MRILVLDDSKIRQKTFQQLLIGNEVVVQVFSATEAIDAFNRSAIDKQPFDLVFLDHDLDEEDPKHTGVQVVEHILTLPPELQPKKAIIHSLNPSGAEKMVSLLRYAQIEVEKISFLTLISGNCYSNFGAFHGNQD